MCVNGNGIAFVIPLFIIDFFHNVLNYDELNWIGITFAFGIALNAACLWPPQILKCLNLGVVNMSVAS